MTEVAKERPPRNVRLVVQGLWVRGHEEWLQDSHPSQTEGEYLVADARFYTPPLQESTRSNIWSTSSVRRP